MQLDYPKLIAAARTELAAAKAEVAQDTLAYDRAVEQGTATDQMYAGMDLESADRRKWNAFRRVMDLYNARARTL